MDTSTTRMFTLPRVIALALITLLVVGLAYLRFAPDPSSVSVPEGAKAGDLILEPCDYPTENGSVLDSGRSGPSNAGGLVPN